MDVRFVEDPMLAGSHIVEFVGRAIEGDPDGYAAVRRVAGAHEPPAVAGEHGHVPGSAASDEGGELLMTARRIYPWPA